jgi:hypothetical protein
MTLSVPISAFVDDEDLLGPFHRGSSWDRLRAVFRAAYALPMQLHDLRLFSEVSGNRPVPQRPVSELCAVVGRGGAKTTAAADIAAFAAVNVDKKRLRPGERAIVLCLAVDKQQAGISFNYIRGYFENVPLLTAMVERVTDDTIDLINGARIIVATNSYRSVRGLTICCAIYDECCFWRDEQSKNPDSEIDAAVSPGLARWPGSIKVLISSPHRRSGLLYRRWKESFGQDDPDCLIVQGGTRQFNPTFPQSIIDRELRRDRELARSEYLAEWRDDLSQLLDRDIIEQSVDRGTFERPREKGASYVAYCDPSGGRGDSFTLAIAHRLRTGEVMLDVIREIPAPLVPAEVVKEFAQILKNYGLHEVTGDNYGAEWTADEFKRSGIRYRPSEKKTVENYLTFLSILNSGLVGLLDHDRAINQLAALERRAGRAGHDAVDHPRGGHDDVACSVAGAVVLAASGVSGPIRVSAAAMAWARRPSWVPAVHAGPPQPITQQVQQVLNLDQARRPSPMTAMQNRILGRS